jgi:hypothetical protein
MVVHYLDVICVRIAPYEADTPLVVDPNAVLAGTVPNQHLQSVSRRLAQVIESFGNIQCRQLPPRNASYLRREPLRNFADEHHRSGLPSEGLDHNRYVSRIALGGKAIVGA